VPVSLLPARRRQVRGVREAWARHPEENDIGGVRLQRALATVSLQQLWRRLFTSPVLRLGIPIQPVPQELPWLPVKRAVVFELGLLLSAYAAADTLCHWRLDRLSLLLPSEVFLSRPSTFTAFLALRGSRPPHLIVSTPRYPMTGGRSNWPRYLSTAAQADLSKTTKSETPRGVNCTSYAEPCCTSYPA
jgi:hypothetical protein